MHLISAIMNKFMAGYKLRNTKRKKGGREEGAQCGARDDNRKTVESLWPDGVASDDAKLELFTHLTYPKG